jgi:ring-1,2-phenylacetyl-CoA epoxidase subunit PaaD
VVERGLPSTAEILAILDEVKDPEVPALSVVELGIVREVASDQSGVTVTVTPTYSGCPAMNEIEEDIRRALESEGIAPVTVRARYSPAWTTDWIGEQAREKLAAYGIAPPGRTRDTELVSILARVKPIACPYCDSKDTERRSEFGSTACKAIWYCRHCHQPFEEFKAL